MRNVRRVRAGLTVVTVLAGAASAQDGIFRTWFEAPETVLAGETFEVEMWASFEGDLLRPEGWFNGSLSSFEVAGDLEVFESVSPLTDWLMLLLSAGEPNGNWLRDTWTVQAPIPGQDVDRRNPLPVLAFNVTTAADHAGTLEIHLRPHSSYAIPYLGWSVTGVDDYVYTTDPHIALIATPAVVRVVPAPAGVALLVLGGVDRRGDVVVGAAEPLVEGALRRNGNDPGPDRLIILPGQRIPPRGVADRLGDGELAEHALESTQQRETLGRRIFLSIDTEHQDRAIPADSGHPLGVVAQSRGQTRCLGPVPVTGQVVDDGVSERRTRRIAATIEVRTG